MSTTFELDEDITSLLNATTATAAVAGRTENLTWPSGCYPLTSADYKDSVTAKMRSRANVYINVYLLTSFLTIAVPANLLAMAVFYRQGLRERINLCLFILAIVDLVVMLFNFCLFYDFVSAELSGSKPQQQWYEFLVRHRLIAVLGGSPYASMFLSTLVALERCCCVLAPLKVKSMLSTKTMGVILLCGHVITCGLRSVVDFRWAFGCTVDVTSVMEGRWEDAVNYATIIPSRFYLDNKDTVDFLDGVVFNIFYPGTCILVVTGSTAVVVHRLHAASRWRANSTCSATTTVSSSAMTFMTATDLSVTRMLVAVSILFVALTTPVCVFRVATLFVPDLSLGGRYHNTYLLVIQVKQLLLYFNCTFNFFFYLATGTRFRKTLHSILPLSMLSRFYHGTQCRRDSRHRTE